MAEEKAMQEGESREVQRSEPTRALSPFDEMERWMDQMFEGFFPRGWPRRFRGGWPQMGELAPFEGRAPRVDVRDREDEVEVQAELPGVKKEDLDVSLSENTLTLKATSRQEKEEGAKEGDYFRREIASGSFARTIPLPGEVDADNAKAKFADGILTLTLPKLEPAKRKRIQVE